MGSLFLEGKSPEGNKVPRLLKDIILFILDWQCCPFYFNTLVTSRKKLLLYTMHLNGDTYIHMAGSNLNNNCLPTLSCLFSFRRPHGMLSDIMTLLANERPSFSHMTDGHVHLSNQWPFCTLLKCKQTWKEEEGQDGVDLGDILNICRIKLLQTPFFGP